MGVLPAGFNFLWGWYNISWLRFGASWVFVCGFGWAVLWGFGLLYGFLVGVDLPVVFGSLWFWGCRGGLVVWGCFWVAVFDWDCSFCVIA